MTIHVSDVVRNKARVDGVEHWVHGLPELIADLERAWSITVGESEPSPPVTQVAAAKRRSPRLLEAVELHSEAPGLSRLEPTTRHGRDVLCAG